MGNKIILAVIVLSLASNAYADDYIKRSAQGGPTSATLDATYYRLDGTNTTGRFWLGSNTYLDLNDKTVSLVVKGKLLQTWTAVIGGNYLVSSPGNNIVSSLGNKLIS